MAHLIEEFDGLISVHQTPWHGLGAILTNAPSSQEAQALAGLTWTVGKYRAMVALAAEMVVVPDRYAIVREDINYPLSVVGGTYEPFQNSDLFDFIGRFCRDTGSAIETAGSLRNGRTVWALAKNKVTEYLAGDPIEKYFLIKNTFDGSSSIEIAFTDVRVVCNNTLTVAIGSAANLWRVCHTRALHNQIAEIERTVSIYGHHQLELKEAMDVLIARQLSPARIREALVHIVAPPSAENRAPAIYNLLPSQAEKVHQMLKLVETGAGTDIAGVRGSAYGVLNAVTEFTDHFHRYRGGQFKAAESKFENILLGHTRDLKQAAFNYLLNEAA